MGNSSKGFTRGNGTFTCITCGKLTRHTTQAHGSDMCAACWDFEGELISLQDSEGKSEEEIAAYCLSMSRCGVHHTPLTSMGGNALKCPKCN